MNLTGKRVNILGAGASGRAAAALALREGAEVHVFEARESIEGAMDGIKLHLGAGTASAEPCDVLVVSPGIDTYGELVSAFSKQAGETLGEVELASRYHKGRIIAITGTNGKTTTTELVERIVDSAGISCVACGNYGRPVCEVVMRDPQPEVLALEASSFQLETIVHFRPDVAIWLNFAPDHMDRYPDVDSYRRAKLRIFENQETSDTAVIRYGENLPAIAAQQVTFSSEDETADWFSNGQHIFHEGEMFLDMHAASHLRGKHNAENAMAAIAASLALGVSKEAIAQAFDGYAPPRHRCELVRIHDEVEWLNDSKATNLHALESALNSQVRPVILIAGGKEKGLDYSPLLPVLKAKALSVITFGQIGKSLADLIATELSVTCVDTLSEAVELAVKQATPGTTVLFSPGTSSFDQFEGYEQRGDTFCQLVNQLR